MTGRPEDRDRAHAWAVLVAARAEYHAARRRYSWAISRYCHATEDDVWRGDYAVRDRGSSTPSRVNVTPHTTQ